MKKGTVKFLNVSKGFGFIKVEGEDQDVFVHISECIEEIQENDEVTFDIKEGKRGPNAVGVKRAK